MGLVPKYGRRTVRATPTVRPSLAIRSVEKVISHFQDNMLPNRKPSGWSALTFSYSDFRTIIWESTRVVAGTSWWSSRARRFFAAT